MRLSELSRLHRARMRLFRWLMAATLACQAAASVMLFAPVPPQPVHLTSIEKGTVAVRWSEERKQAMQAAQAMLLSDGR